MHNFKSLPTLLLLSLLQSANSAPVEPQVLPRTEEILVRDYNTLNSTSGRSVTVSSTSKVTYPNGTTTVTTANLTRSAGGRLVAFPPASVLASANLTTTDTSASKIASEKSADGVLTLSIVNKWPSTNLHVYVSGLDTSGTLVMLGTDGKYLYPTTSSGTPVPVSGNIAIPVGARNTTLNLVLPDYLTSSRVWVVDGTLSFYVVTTPNGPGLVEPSAVNAVDPNSQKNYAFAELSQAASYGIYADITAVDFIGLPLGIELIDASNNVQSILGTPANAATVLCNSLIAQTKSDGQPWEQSCVYGTENNNLIRVLAPSNLISQKPAAFTNYFARYIDNVWNKFRNEDLIINTQTDAGNVTCRVRGSLLYCNGDNRPYPKPVAEDIFGCNSGPFTVQGGDNGIHVAVVPRLCAAFNRATFFLKGGNVQPGLPASEYYRNPRSGPNSIIGGPPKNWYSKYVHDIEWKGMGYAFAYDDVTPSPEEEQSGLVAATNPTMLRIIVGGTGP